MTRILHLELSTGAAGDKLLGALLEVCERLDLASFDDLRRLASALVPDIRVERTRVLRGGNAATYLKAEEPNAPVRHMSEIRALIKDAAARGLFSEVVAKYALKAFGYIAESEAAVHNQPVDQVHFHEVGAADSIFDIVGSSFLFDALKPQAVYATSLALGSGTVTCSHGLLPVPTPATTRIVEGMPVYAGAFNGELTTPTGAALVRVFVTHFAPLPHCVMTTIGYGAGYRELEGGSNVVRALVGETSEGAFEGISGGISGGVSGGISGGISGGVFERASKETSTETSSNSADKRLLTLEGCILLETNIDHRSPEALAHMCDDLLASGALDVWQEPITMKKGRLAVKLCLLCTAGDSNRFCKQIITATGTLGVRQRYIERRVAPRAQITLKTPYGPVPFKIARFIEPDASDSDTVWLRPEHDTVSILAREYHLDYQELYAELVNHGLDALGTSNALDTPNTPNAPDAPNAHFTL